MANVSRFYKKNLTIIMHSWKFTRMPNVNATVHWKRFKFTPKIVSQYDQEIPQSQTADKPMAPRGRATQQSRDTTGKQTKQSKELYDCLVKHKLYFKLLLFEKCGDISLFTAAINIPPRDKLILGLTYLLLLPLNVNSLYILSIPGSSSTILDVLACADAIIFRQRSQYKRGSDERWVLKWTSLNLRNCCI